MAAPRALFVLLLSTGVSADVHTFSGTGAMVRNPERGFRDELHGACTGEWSPSQQGFSQDDMLAMQTLNLTIAQVRVIEIPLRHIVLHEKVPANRAFFAADLPSAWVVVRLLV
jgi:hypothetical protein